MLNPSLHERLNELAARFQQRDPFRYVVIDDFFSAEYCSELLAQFPAFGSGNARNEAGELGNKSTVKKIRGIGPAYAALDDALRTREFLDLIGSITGIPNLLYDPWYFGGGTHENRNGQALDAHVDFNKHPIERWHRRLNLIAYLNPAWDDAWGGSLQLHSDPRAPADRVTTITPLYNRVVIFETTEWSWHGFPRITLPGNKDGLSRKSVALYFYTTDRPAEELADTHSTIYVDQPLPQRFRDGLMLKANDVEELRELLARRDQHNQRLYRDITALTQQLDDAQVALRRGLLGRLYYFAQRFLAR
jgi:hypothetical protein